MTNAIHGEDFYTVIHGLRHHYVRWGDPGKDPVILLHGLMNNGRYWEHIAPALATDYCVYAPDFRGHGESEHAPGGYLVWAFAMDLRALIEELDLETFDLVAHSIGSRVAMAYARDHQARIKHLALVDMGPQMADSGARGIRKTTGNAQTQPGFPTEADAIKHFATLYPGRDEDFLRRQLHASLTLDEASGNLSFRFDPEVHQATGRGAIVEIPYLWESLEHITCPTLVVRAAKSRILSAEIQEQMCARLPNSRSLVIEDAGHQLPLHQPEAFTAAIREFLAS